MVSSDVNISPYTAAIRQVYNCWSVSEGIYCAKTSVTLDMQDTYKLKVKYSPTNTTVKKEVTWISSNTDVEGVEICYVTENFKIAF